MTCAVAWCACSPILVDNRHGQTSVPVRPGLRRQARHRPRRMRPGRSAAAARRSARPCWPPTPSAPASFWRRPSAKRSSSAPSSPSTASTPCLPKSRSPTSPSGILRRGLADSGGTVLLLGELRWEPSAWLPIRAGLRLDLSPLAAGDRVRLWRSQVDGQLPAGRRRRARRPLPTGRRRRDPARSTAEARSRAELRGATEVELDDVRAAARTIATPPLEGLARHIEPRYGWDDIVLPADGLAQLREMCARARHQMTVLEQLGLRPQARPPARHRPRCSPGRRARARRWPPRSSPASLGLDLYRIDLSAVVSKYIGETEKNLERIFRAADQGDAVLLFDEADAIFGKRSEVRDAHDRYANVEVAYLLQRLETYDGLAVLTTNLRGNIDEAFVRRLDCVLEFPLPEEAERLQIWRRALPARGAAGADVDLAFLARKFKLAGGHIRNIALTAAFLAAEDGEPIGMQHLARATRREYQKLGKLVAESDFEQHYSLLKDDTTASEG